jgi:hypothetical protein
MTTHDPAAAAFEVTVSGGVGPVLRRALRPGRVVESHVCTVVRAVGAADLASVVALVDSLGLRLEVLLVVRPPRTSYLLRDLGPPHAG